ncbi:MAG TPA: hypothetical protein EYO33_33740 [Phycisphaerales bacterium]|nr:hypothetical protein [Phycisphaerales bacterium]
MQSRVFENYKDVLRKRLRLWLSDEVEVSTSALSELRVRYGERSAELGFIPSQCLWWMAHGDCRTVGNFDRLSKNLRRFLTSSLQEEEG